MRVFLRLNNYTLVVKVSEQIEMVLAVESDRWGVDEIEAWLRRYAASSSHERL